MRSYLIGLTTGLALASGAAYAGGIGIYGGPGYMNGWDIVIEGDTVCHDPYVWPATREIECE